MQEVLDEAVRQVTHVEDGQVGDTSPYRKGDRQPFGVAAITAGGSTFSAGDSGEPFAIQSISKAVVYAMALEEHGFETVARYVDIEPSGERYDTISVEDSTGRPDNPMINAGAITVHGLLGGPDATADSRTERVLDTFSKLAGRELGIDEHLLKLERESSDRNLAIAHMLRALEILPDDPREVLEGYLRQCCISVTTEDLCMIGATFAAGGINPNTGRRVFSEPVVRQTLSVMMTCGMYDSAGDWVSEVGIASKSGVGGGILGVVPGRGAIATFGPKLDDHGTSVRGQLVFEKLSDELGLHFVDVMHGQDQRWARAVEEALAAEPRSKSRSKSSRKSGGEPASVAQPDTAAKEQRKVPGAN